jgi:hypothetical protein
MQRVLLGLSQGVPLAVIAHQNGVHRSTIHAWRAEDQEFARAYEYARDLGWDRIACECLQIVDDTSDDLVIDAHGVPRPNVEAVRRAKLRVESRLRLLAKWDSGRYGKRRAIKSVAESTETRRHVIDPRSLDKAGRAALRQLLAAAEAQGLIENGPEVGIDVPDGGRVRR